MNIGYDVKFNSDGTWNIDMNFWTTVVLKLLFISTYREIYEKYVK